MHNILDKYTLLYKKFPENFIDLHGFLEYNPCKFYFLQIFPWFNLKALLMLSPPFFTRCIISTGISDDYYKMTYYS
jgi:hypothetical protein